MNTEYWHEDTLGKWLQVTPRRRFDKSKMKFLRMGIRWY
jgi:hypothetical protein